MIDRYAPDVLACWAYWEALRRLGFSSDDIFVSVYYEAVLGYDVCGVVLRTQCREFVINAAKLTRSSEAFVNAWIEFGGDVIAGRVPLKALEPVWAKRPADIGMLPFGLIEKGFRLPMGGS